MKIINLLLFFILLIIINSINSNLRADILSPYIEKTFLLSNSNPKVIYSYYPRITDSNHEIILQIKSNYNGKAYICTGYFKNIREENIENIYYNSEKNEFENCQKKFSIESIQNIMEFNITYDMNSTNQRNIVNSYYYIGLCIDKMFGIDFSGSIILFNTNSNILIDQNIITKYYSFKNNYLYKNYSFIIYPNKLIQRNLHLQIIALNENNTFNINITNNNNYILEEKENISSYNNFFDLSDVNYTLNLFFLKDNKEIEDLDFAIYFEYSQINGNFMALTDKINEINFLIRSYYYFYQIINDNNDNIDKLYYIVNDFSLKRGMVSLSSIEENMDINEVSNHTYIENKILTSNFVTCKSRAWNSFAFFRCFKNKNDSNIIILRISSSGINPLNIRKVHFKELKRTIIDEKNNGLYYQSFNSQNLVDKFGYIYIPIINNDTKRQLIYCSKENTLSVYFEDYDIVEQNSAISFLDKLRLFKLSHSKSDYENKNFSGFTIITYNKDINYFIQLIDINKDIYDNLLIERMLDSEHLNKEFKYDSPIKNYYYFFMNDYNGESQNIIFDVQVLYGIIDTKYINIDSISEKDFNLNEIILFNNNDSFVTDANHPILIKQTTEFIKVTNLNYNLKYYNKAKIYLNKYYYKDIKKLDNLIPIYLNPLESKKILLENIYGNVKYAFKLGNNYDAYTNDLDENLVNIIIGNNKVNNIFNLTNRENYIIGNISDINFGDTIEYINNYNKSILIWSSIGNLVEGNEYIKSLYISKNYYYLYGFNLVHKLIFDWGNIKEKIKYGLIPQKILISLLNEKQTKVNGYYYEIIHLGEDNNDFSFYYSNINSIYYELGQGESLVFLNDYLNITELNFYFKSNKYLYFMVYPSSGLSSILFYLEYLYDISNSINELKFLEFDDSVYSINLKMENNYINNMILYNNYNYLVFQCLSCNLAISNVSFKFNNNIYPQDTYNETNYIIKTISSGNIVGYIKLDNLKNITENDNLYINIIKPYLAYVKYYYVSNININYIYQNNYNINIGKDNSQNIIISFDCFIKKIKTNYTILILNKSEIKKEITNECEFFLYLDKRNNITSNIKYLSFVDENENIRIKKEISFDKLGNYGIYILAQTLENLSIYKYLGTESYNYINDFYPNTNNENLENKSTEIVAILIFIILIFILITLYFVFRCVRKNKLIRLYNSINNNSFLRRDLENLKSSINNIIKSNNKSNVNDNNNYLLFEKPNKVNENEKYNDNNNIINNNDSELDPDILGQSAAPLLGETFCSEEDKIRNELAKINETPNKIDNNNDIEKKYINTNKGNG